LHLIRGYGDGASGGGNDGTSGSNDNGSDNGSIPNNPNPDTNNSQSTPPQSTPNFPFTPQQWEDMIYSTRQQFLQSQITITDGDRWLASGGSGGSSSTNDSTIWNWPLNSIVIKKTCSVTGRLLPNATFNLVHTSAGVSGTLGTSIGLFTTGSSGIIVVTGLVPGSYVVFEEIPPPNFTLSVNNTQTAFLAPDGHSAVELNFANDPYGSLLITKRCEITNRPLQHAEFRVTRSDGSVVGTSNGIFITNQQGYVLIPNLPPDTYIVTEVRSPNGFHLDGAPQTIRVNASGNTYQVNFTNLPYSTLIIRKLDASNLSPLEGARFEIRRTNGEWVGSFVTDANGLITIPNVTGWFSVTEVSPPQGFMLGDNPTQIVEVVAGSGISGSGLSGDSILGNPSGNVGGTGSSVSSTSNTITPTILTFLNHRYSNLTIRKVNSITLAPLEGVIFEISRPDGTRLVNPQTGFHDFVTDRNGLIFLPVIEDGRFYLREVRALPGFIVDEEVIALNIDASTRQREHLLVVENTPAAGLLIIKRCANTGRPLQNVEFEVRYADGRLVRGLMADGNQPNTPANSPNIAPNGNFLTDHRGMIHLNHLESGVFYVTEKRALPGFLLDSTVHVVTITPGRLTTLEVVNEQMAGLRLLKIDSVTRQGIPNVEFRIFDFITNQEVAGPFITDNNGVIDLMGVLPAGRYVIRETRSAQGYLIDTTPRTIELRAGMVTELTWENTREAGQIQITKLSIADNQVNGLPAGTRLAGAVFEVRDWRTGNLVDQFATDARGVGVSRPLPLGRYLITEIVAPSFYIRSDIVLDVTIEHSGQILRYEFFNEPANLGVEIRKTGPVEVMSGQPIVWSITTIANSSNIELSDFYVRDILPAHAVRLDRIFTGSFNQSLRYSIMFRTNLNDEWRVAYDNLDSTKNNALVMSPAALGLLSNEHVTEIMYSFGTVRAGFRSVVAPRIEGTVRDGLQNGYEFVNRVDVGGRVTTREISGAASGTGEWVVGNGVWVTRVHRPAQGQHPRTGW